MSRNTSFSRVKAAIPILLLLLGILILTLGGCGDDSEISGGETTYIEVASSTVDLTPSGDSDASGTATITETPGGVAVSLDVSNLTDAAGTAHGTHVHEGGTCDDDRAGNSAEIRYPLVPVNTGPDGTASSMSAIQGVSLAQLTSDPPKYIDVHDAQEDSEVPPAEVPPAIACADLPSTGG